MPAFDLPPPADLLAAVYDKYLQFSCHESVLALTDLIGEPDEAMLFHGFCTLGGGVRGLDYMRQISNAILNAAFYTASFATSTRARVPLTFPFDPEIPALSVPIAGLTRTCVLYACEATLDLTPWVEVEHGQVRYHPTGAAKQAVADQRHRMLSVPVPALLRYAPAEATLLQPAVTAIAARLWQQSTPDRISTRELDALAGRYLNRGQLAW